MERTTNGRLRIDADATLAEKITRTLEGAGFRYEEHWQCLYGAGWEITGVEIMGRRAEVVAVLAEAGLLAEAVER